ncbi:hypothetical protein RC1_4108 [Rhodospirillum centenum SW]|uniref:Uncharacterized protein n=1 Tax=Rhodospirillum centenum (strain ATCC 51521 / SW) TaxID=414684 RepID=B6IYS3_RHOCS|nr:hypothetical protein RC1_4108 [Rhodospirillum centenum SW]
MCHREGAAPSGRPFRVRVPSPASTMAGPARLRFHCGVRVAA